MRIFLTPDTHYKRNVFWAVNIAAFIILSISLVVLIAWLTHNSQIIQVKPTYSPFKFNSVLSFMLIGIGFYGLLYFKPVAYFCGLIVAMIGILTIAQIIMGVNFSIDELFVSYYIPFPTPSPGRMAPQAMIVHSFAGICLCILAQKKINKMSEFIILLFSAIIITICLIALLGYIFTPLATLFRWGNHPEIALLATINGTIVGFTLMGVRLLELKRDEFIFLPLLPIILFICSSLAMILIYRGILKYRWLEIEAWVFNNFILISLVISSIIAFIFYHFIHGLRHFQFTNTVIESTHECLMVLDPDGFIRYANSAVERFLEVSKNELIGSFATNLFAFSNSSSSGNAPITLLDIIKSLPQISSYQNSEVTLHYNHLKPKSVLLAMRMIYQRNKPSSVVVNFSDISHIKNIEQELTNKTLKLEQSKNKIEAMYLAISTAGNIGLLHLDKKKRIIYISEQIFYLLGPQVEHYLNKSFFDLFKSHISKKLNIFFTESTKNKSSKPFDYYVDFPGAKVRWVTFHINPQYESESNLLGFVITVTDATRMKEMETTIQKVLHNNPYSGIPNRASALEHLTQLLRNKELKKRKVAIIKITIINYMQLINQLAEQQIGSLIKQIVAIFAEEKNKYDKLFQPEPHVFLIISSDYETVKQIIFTNKRVSMRLGEPIHVDNYQLFCKVSSEIVFYPDVIKKIDELKQFISLPSKLIIETKGYQLFQYDELKNISLREKILSKLRQGIENKTLSMVYQPYLDLKNHKCCGAEALIRWNDPVLGNIKPDLFIPIAESDPFIINLTEWILHSVFEQMSQWNTINLKDQQLDLTQLHVSINISVSYLLTSGISHHIEGLYHQHKIKPQQTSIEITETALIGKVDIVQKELNNLSQLGIDIAADDFGTGYSSLSYLRQYPITTLKIDKSFIDTIVGNATSMNMVRDIIQMGKNLGIKAIAEGVETKEQMDLLIEAGCDVIQGYYYSKPLMPDDFLLFFSKNN